MANFDNEVPADLAASYRRHRQSDTPPMVKAIGTVILVAAGVYLGNVLYTRYMIYEASKAVQEATLQFQAEMQAQAERARQHQLAVERERTLRKQMELDAQLAQQARQAATMEAAHQKELAWDRYYKKPAQCDLPQQNNALMVECANHHMREKKKFEDAWAARGGRLSVQ